jgi:Lar family restriction alleviation protein
MLPCPFCESPVSREDVIGGRDGSSHTFVLCTPCGSHGPCDNRTVEDAIAAWNRRADTFTEIEDRLRKDARQLRKQRGEVKGEGK